MTHGLYRGMLAVAWLPEGWSMERKWEEETTSESVGRITRWNRSGCGVEKKLEDQREQRCMLRREATDGKEQVKERAGDKQRFISVLSYTSAHCPGAPVSGVLFKLPTAWHQPRLQSSSGPRASSPAFHQPVSALREITISQWDKDSNLHSPSE